LQAAIAGHHQIEAVAAVVDGGDDAVAAAAHLRAAAVDPARQVNDLSPRRAGDRPAVQFDGAVGVFRAEVERAAPSRRCMFGAPCQLLVGQPCNGVGGGEAARVGCRRPWPSSNRNSTIGRAGVGTSNAIRAGVVSRFGAGARSCTSRTESVYACRRSARR
jgi:hypothetical protein